MPQRRHLLQLHPALRPFDWAVARMKGEPTQIFDAATRVMKPWPRYMAEKRMPAWRITEAFIARVPRLAPRLYSLERARHLIQKARAEAGLPKHMTLAACDHGGMTELGDAGLTEPQIMSWCAQETPAPARVYVKRTELQRVTAARKRRQFVERGS